ncbi:Arabinan endo-1,5-alpha-L-arabinanase [Penicillium ucsense]|uniref:Arabinan endo-1,5-alpha-L-arabinanase n=1 Tax=Penicillium ucsense TaxID=2839758 RepID=A0A8J8VY67_9EURO|nr:Arabinan endo-1,5-alpha-L-arabinanase [Penicillium ucsense]KAF7730337.1 Arabinan endo-1,5-alpha-L-arabinanase [Penicillium ucsense]
MSSNTRFAFALSLLMGSSAIAEPTLAINSDFADPSVISTGDGHYAFATGGNGVNVQMAHSTDLTNWELMSGHDAMPGPYPSWVAGSPAIWAPDVIQRDDGKFIMYVSASASQDASKHCVGAAVADQVTGPYTLEQSPLACPLDKGGAIDADGFKDGNTYYVVYKVDGNSLNQGSTLNPTPIMLQQLNSDGVTPNGDPVQLIDRDNNDGPLVEAPSLVNVGGTYYLTFSSNWYNTPKYDVSYAIASSVTGPYNKVQYPDAPLLVSGHSSSAGALSGPGGADFNGDGSKIVFHAFKNGKNIDDGRAMYVADINVSNGVIHVL